MLDLPGGRPESMFLLAFTLLICLNLKMRVQYELVIPPRYTVQLNTMSMPAVTVFSWNVWNGVTLDLDEQKVRLYQHVFEADAIIRD